MMEEDDFIGLLRLGVGPRFEDLLNHSVGPDGAVDLSKVEALKGRFGKNGSVDCDTLSGPCSCGAWHKPGDKIENPDGTWRNTTEEEHRMLLANESGNREDN